MRIYGDTNRVGLDPRTYVIQVAPTPKVGVGVAGNGKFVIDVPEGVPVPDPVPSTLSSLLDDIYGGLLVGTSFNFVQYNALLTTADQAKLDPTAVFPYDSGPPVRTWAMRAQVGRSGAISDNGLAPNGVKVLASNTTVVPTRPGVLITDTIDVSADVPAGVTSFSVYWKLLGVATGDDVMDYGTPTNEPAIRTITEVSQNPSGFEVYASSNDGAGYTRVSRLVPITVSAGTSLRVAFVNKGASPVCLIAYAVLY